MAAASGGAVCLGLLLGGLLTTSGCTLCQCPELDPLALGMLDISASTSRPELVGGGVELESQRVRISYFDGTHDWVATYAVESRTPEDD